MNRLLPGLLIFIIATILTACNATKQALFTPVSISNEQSAVYIYRPVSMSNAMYSPDIFVNGEFKLEIANGKNRLISLSPGNYRFEIAPDKKYSGTTTAHLDLSPGSIQYLRVDTSLKIQSTLNYAPYERSFNLIKVDANQALSEISECCSHAKITNKKETEAKPAKTSDGFSTDKTHNPFSH